MKILITGGGGYKGIVLTTRLLDLGHQITVLDNFMFGYEPILHLVVRPSLTIEQGDIRNVDAKIVGQHDVIIHLAGLSGYPACEANPHSAKLINVEASRRLSSLLGKEQVLIFASTTSLYGKTDVDGTTEDSPVNPVSLYGITKYQGEQIFMERERSIAFRFATIFGVSPKMRVDLLVNDFTYRAVHDRCIVLFESGSKRTFLHLQDAVDAYVLAVDRPEAMQGEIFNVGHESMNYTKLEIAQHIEQATQCTIIDSDIEDLDVRDFSISYEKIKRLGFMPRRSLDDGISELVRVYKFYKPFSPFKVI